MEADEAGRLRAFREKFGRGWDAERMGEEDERVARGGGEGVGEGMGEGMGEREGRGEEEEEDNLIGGVWCPG